MVDLARRHGDLAARLEVSAVGLAGLDASPGSEPSILSCRTSESSP